MTGKLKALSTAKKILLGVGAFTVLAGVIGATTSPQKTNTNNVEKPQTNQTQVKGDSTRVAPKVETKTVQETVAILYQSRTENDSSLPSGQTNVIPGSNGEKLVTYEVTYTDGVETNRKIVNEQITKPAVDQVTRVGTKVVQAPKTTSCSGGYINSDGNCIPSPSNNPAGATAQCNDGTYSYSQHHSGTCSHHGGVAQWL